MSVVMNQHDQTVCSQLIHFFAVYLMTPVYYQIEALLAKRKGCVDTNLYSPIYDLLDLFMHEFKGGSSMNVQWKAWTEDYDWRVEQLRRLRGKRQLRECRKVTDKLARLLKKDPNSLMEYGAFQIRESS